MAAIEWNVRPGAKVSVVSGEPFTEGDRIVCLLFATDQPGELGRADLLEAELDAFKLNGTLLGRWSRVVKSAADEAKEAQRLTAASAESLFFSLFDDARSAPAAVDNEADWEQALALRAVLQHFVGLLLERRRILKAVGRRSISGRQNYWHPKEKRNFEVPVCELSPMMIARIKDVIGELV
jgi:hypothetical protein